VGQADPSFHKVSAVSTGQERHPVPGAGAEAKVDAGGKVCVEALLGQRAA